MKNLTDFRKTVETDVDPRLFIIHLYYFCILNFFYITTSTVFNFFLNFHYSLI